MKKIQKGRKKLKSIKTLKNKAWKVFSEWVRRRNGGGDYSICVTCGALRPWKELHAGHFIHGHSKPTFFDERNVWPQCVKCNHFLSGNLLEYVEFIRKHQGQEAIDALRELSHQVVKFNRDYYEELIATYTKKLEELGGLK